MNQSGLKLVRLLFLVTLILVVTFIAIQTADQVALGQVFAAVGIVPNPVNTGQITAITSAHTLLLLADRPNFIFLPVVAR